MSINLGIGLDNSIGRVRVHSIWCYWFKSSSKHLKKIKGEYEMTVEQVLALKENRLKVLSEKGNGDTGVIRKLTREIRNMKAAAGL